ncbi:MAG: GNAT family N-acetyltransferase [Planctomycetota bacterium]
MRIQIFTNLDALSTVAREWNELAAGAPLRSYDWHATWQRHYGDASRGGLLVLGVFDGDRLIGLAPWRIERSLRRGTTIRWLGDGEVCTDHPTILSVRNAEQAVAATLADYLAAERGDWQLIDLADVDRDEVAVDLLGDELASRGSIVDRAPAGSCWRLTLPESWEALLQQQSKSHRKQLRRSERFIETSDSFVWHAVSTAEDLQRAWPLLEDLHQRRRRSLGEPGCFASPKWAAYHREVSKQLLAEGRLRLFWSELDGRPFTAEYAFAGVGVWHAYQGGLDPDRLDISPGRLSMISLIRSAMEEGVREIDFMRGDEPYKPHWRAAPHATDHVRIVPPRLSAQLRNQADRVARRFRGVARAGLRAFAQSD